MADDDVDWFDTNNSSIVVRQQMAIAVFRNGRDEIALRQQNEPWEDGEEAWICFQPEHAATVARAILNVAGIDPADAFPELYSQLMHDIGNSVGASKGPKDRTKSERQKRYRQRLKVKGDVTRDSDATGATYSDGNGAPSTPSIGDGSDAPGFELEAANG